MSATRVTAVLLSQRPSWDSVVWALRLWRVCAAYGEGLTAVSELLLAAQLQGHSVKRECKDKDMNDRQHTLLATVAMAVGPGMLARAGSLRRVTAVLWLLEQSAVSCAAIIDMHTTRATSAVEKSVGGKRAVTQEAQAKELEEDERVGRALETARLLLGVGERLVLVIQSVAEEEEGEGALERAPDAVIMVAAAKHFVASVLGTNQSSSSPGSDLRSDLRSDPVSLTALTAYSLRQHTAENSLSINPSSGNGNGSWSGNYSGRSAGKGLLQSCTSYAQYVRTASAHQHISDNTETNSETNTTTNTNAGDETAAAAVVSTSAYNDNDIIAPLAVTPIRRPQYQFAALHHLESSISSFIEMHITSRLLIAMYPRTSPSLSLSLSLSPFPAASNDTHALLQGRSQGDCAFSEWVMHEDMLSRARLFSNALSFFTKTKALKGESQCHLFLLSLSS